MNHFLLDKNILLTRPSAQAAGLGALIKQLGASPIFFPTLEILPVHDHHYFTTVADQLSKYQIAIFTSANAVRFALAACSTPNPNISIIAIGPGTARELRKFNIHTISIPESHSSEGLLNLDILNHITKKNIIIFCGENPRPLLKQTLLARGADVTEIFCYKRQIPSINAAEKIAELKRIGIHLIISTSLENLANLWELLAKIDKIWLQKIPLLVISHAMLIQARQLGIETIVLANGASDEAIYEKLQNLDRIRDSS